METITRNVKDIGSEDRRALEHMIGKRLAEDQQVVINVVNLNASLPTHENAKVSQEVPGWWKVYEGLGDEEIDRLDHAIRQRANLTRTFE
jgi:hypothetical protein